MPLGWPENPSPGSSTFVDLGIVRVLDLLFPTGDAPGVTAVTAAAIRAVDRGRDAPSRERGRVAL
jgi:hypothetical protein